MDRSDIIKSLGEYIVTVGNPSVDTDKVIHYSMPLIVSLLTDLVIRVDDVRDNMESMQRDLNKIQDRTSN